MKNASDNLSMEDWLLYMSVMKKKVIGLMIGLLYMSVMKKSDRPNDWFIIYVCDEKKSDRPIH